MHPEIKRVTLFLLSGGIVFTVAFSLNWTLFYWLSLSPLLAYILSAIPVFFLSFFLQSRVVFESRRANLKTYALFLASVLLSNAFGALILSLFLRLAVYEISVIVALGSQSLISYFVLKRIVFSSCTSDTY